MQGSKIVIFSRTTAILTSLYKLTIITKFHLLSQSNFSLVKSFKNTKNKIITNKLVELWAWKIHARNTGFVLAISKYTGSLKVGKPEGTYHYSGVLNLYLKRGSSNIEENKKLKKQKINSMNLLFILLLSASHTTIFLSYCFW